MGKKTAAVRKKPPGKPPATAAAPAKPGPRKHPASSAPASGPANSTVDSPVAFTNVDKVWFPESGVTKGAVLHYYLQVADKLLPHLRDRPMTLERLPDGIAEGKPRFWQKNTPDYYPSWIPRIELTTDEGKSVKYALVNDVRTLAYLVNQGTITFHPFLARVQSLDRPDFVVFDLDPGGARFADVVRIARTVRDLLQKQKVESFPKTSGKSGLHVLAPWRRPGGFDAARAWAMDIARATVAELPALATVERSKSARGGRVYVDVIQNAPVRHIVPPYVVRPAPGATVSTPLDWKEVTPKLDPRRFDVRTAPKRFAGKPDMLAILTRR